MEVVNFKAFAINIKIFLTIFFRMITLTLERNPELSKLLSVLLAVSIYSGTWKHPFPFKCYMISRVGVDGRGTLLGWGRRKLLFGSWCVKYREEDSGRSRRKWVANIEHDVKDLYLQGTWTKGPQIGSEGEELSQY